MHTEIKSGLSQLRTRASRYILCSLPEYLVRVYANQTPHYLERFDHFAQEFMLSNEAQL